MTLISHLPTLTFSPTNSMQPSSTPTQIPTTTAANPKSSISVGTISAVSASGAAAIAGGAYYVFVKSSTAVIVPETFSINV